MRSTWESQLEVPVRFLRILLPEKRLKLYISRSQERIRRKGRNEDHRFTGRKKYFVKCCPSR